MEVRMCKNYEWGKFWHKIDDDNYWHREDGPAEIWYDGQERWWYYNKCYHHKEMPLILFLAYCKWKYNKNGN